MNFTRAMFYFERKRVALVCAARIARLEVVVHIFRYARERFSVTVQRVSRKLIGMSTRKNNP